MAKYRSSVSNPRHIAIIMDGNTRWANKNSLPSIQGYRSGMENTKRIILASIRAEIESISLFALSSENWRRPVKETRQLLKVFDQALDEGVPEFHEKDARFTFIGERWVFPDSMVKKMNYTEELTKNNKGLRINIAINYGGQWDITQACKALAEQVKTKKLNPNRITDKLISKHLTLADQPPIDLCIRTGNEKRISNFFLWQLAYTELYFSKLFWPEFNERNFYAAIADFKKRSRRFGGSSNKK